MGRGGSWETWRDQGRINDGETSPLPGREEGLRGILRGIRSSPSLETLEQGMGKDGP